MAKEGETRIWTLTKKLKRDKKVSSEAKRRLFFGSNSLTLLVGSFVQKYLELLCLSSSSHAVHQVLEENILSQRSEIAEKNKKSLAEMMIYSYSETPASSWA